MSPYFSRDSRKSFVGPGNSSSLSAARRPVASAASLRRGQVGDVLLGLPALERLGPERLRPAAGRVAELAGEEADDRVRHVEAARVLGELLRVRADRDQVQRQVTDHLRARRHLDDVAEDVVGGGVHVLDLLEPLAEAERDRLLAQVGQLAAGDLVGVDPAGRRGQAGLERRVDAAGRLPVGLEVADRLQVEPGLPRRSGRSRRPATTAPAGWWCRPSRRTPRRRRRRRRRSPRAASRAGRPGCRGCAGAPAGRTRSRSAVTSVRAAGARSSPAMSLIASTCAPASTICSASRR